MSETTHQHRSAQEIFYRSKVALVAFVFNLSQEHKIYNNSSKGLRPIRSPSDYPELKDFTIEENFLKVPAFTFADKERNPAGVAGYVPEHPPREERICLWEKQAEPGKPHYLLFQSTNGHWGDAWPVHDPDHIKEKLSPEDYAEVMERNRRAPRDFLRKIAGSGAGFTAVSLRGYGKSDGEPNQPAHECDIDAVVQHVLHERNVPPHTVAVLGISLGTWAATYAGAKMTDLGKPPLLLGLVNPFSGMDKLGAEAINDDKNVRRLGVRMSRGLVGQPAMLRHPMRTSELVARLSPETQICIFTSGKDERIPPQHSSRLMRAMYKRALKIHHESFPNAYHGTIPCDELIRVTQEAYEHCASQEENCGRRSYWRHHAGKTGGTSGAAPQVG